MNKFIGKRARFVGVLGLIASDPGYVARSGSGMEHRTSGWTPHPAVCLGDFEIDPVHALARDRIA